MKRRTLEIVFTPSGEVEIEAMGFAGADCEKATAFLEEALGRLSQRRRKPEFYQLARARAQQKVGV
jgi:hypothetical protein